ncbi:MAG: 5-(carboxyamino)imidazole ribonucleotide mutase [Actinomycetota bacterium]|nr:5-(carboxyamino)imidazole ribonucleotide mutase [Actinomycetota bacterium]
MTVAIVMGSDSDFAVMSEAAEALAEVGVAYEMRVLSAHRTPEDTLAYARSAASRGVKVVIAGAGGAAHLPGVIAAATRLPVIGVPIALSKLDGLDSLLSIVQMPKGIPVATVAIDGARNAGLLAARILAVSDEAVAAALDRVAAEMVAEARVRDASLEQKAKELGR